MNNTLLMDEKLSKRELLNIINTLKLSLSTAAIELGLSNIKTVEISQMLDIYIAKYQALL